MADGPAVVSDRTTRKTICLSQPKPDVVIHDGDAQFPEELAKLYSEHESRALEGLIGLKEALKDTPKDSFWSFLSERLADLLGAQMSFISKRMLVDEQDRAVEMPPIGATGSCLMASALYYNDGHGASDTLSAFKYHAYGCPCGYMKHDKVFVIPEKLNSFILDNPNTLPFSAESYMAVPLFAEGKCFAHFGIIWSEEGAKNRKLSWANIELILHSLEEVILDHLLEGTPFREGDGQSRERNRIIPHAAVTAAQSLKPYARSLSHELRTPMQGVVGLTDLMYATVLEAAENTKDPALRLIFDSLKESIEIVQDSSRRAVEAADNVVHAYDMDMSIPEPYHSMTTEESLTPTRSNGTSIDRPSILVAGSNLPIERPNKRRRADDGGVNGSPAKIAATAAEWAKRSEPSDELVKGVNEAERLNHSTAGPLADEQYHVQRFPSPPKNGELSVAPGLRHTQIRSVIQYVVNESLKVGGRPESAINHETPHGERIEVTESKGTGELRKKVIEWSVEPNVPTTILVDEKDLGKLISCVCGNALKFCDQGKISITARSSSRSRHIVIEISDTGPGIEKEFLRNRLFRPFSQENASLTRQSEGLGLGLLVAKGLARKLGGDLICTRTETEGPNHGTDFEIRIPVNPADHISRPASPFSPSPHSVRHGSRSDESTSGSTVGNPLPTPTEGEDQLGGKPKSSGQTSDEAKPRPLSNLMRNPSLPQTPLLERRDKVEFQAPPSPSPSRSVAPPKRDAASVKRPAMVPRKSSASMSNIDRDLAVKYPLTFLVAEDNKINRKLLVNMLSKFGYKTIHEAYDGAEAVRQMERHGHVDVVLMDLWMPFMDGYEATQKILAMDWESRGAGGGGDGGQGKKKPPPTVLAVTADVTDGALDKAAKVGMRGFMTKPFKLSDLQRLIIEYCRGKGEEDSGVEA